jgi:hypothetical protein
METPIMTSEFTPHNDLEEQLLAAQQARIAAEELINTLMQSEVFMPVYEKHQTGGLQTSNKAKPLTLKTEDGDEVLVLFTSPERAKAFVRDYPGYEGGLLAEFMWILEKMGIGFGITLNPDQAVGIDFEASDLKQMATLISRRQH